MSDIMSPEPRQKIEELRRKKHIRQFGNVQLNVADLRGQWRAAVEKKAEEIGEFAEFLEKLFNDQIEKFLNRNEFDRKDFENFLQYLWELEGDVDPNHKNSKIRKELIQELADFANAQGLEPKIILGSPINFPKTFEAV